MKFNGILFKDHEPYTCSIETSDITKIDDQWYSVQITERIEFKYGYSKLAEEDKEYGFEISVPNQEQKIFIKNGTTICVKANTKSDQCHYVVTRKNGDIKKTECKFQFELP
ncbi:MAG: hypothetical protein WC895_01155 [Candidatus Shapirobacteria bacterium]|jgi:hypothetical protein